MYLICRCAQHIQILEGNAAHAVMFLYAPRTDSLNFLDLNCKLQIRKNKNKAKRGRMIQWLGQSPRRWEICGNVPDLPQMSSGNQNKTHSSSGAWAAALLTGVLRGSKAAQTLWRWGARLTPWREESAHERAQRVCSLLKQSVLTCLCAEQGPMVCNSAMHGDLASSSNPRPQPGLGVHCARHSISRDSQPLA